MVIWFSSDYHFGHHNIIEYCDRPFESADIMNDQLVNRHNELVKPADTVYMIGDVSMNPKYLYLVAYMNGIKHLVPGNHDKCWTGNPKWVQRYIDAGFSSINRELEISIGGHAVLLNHLPYQSRDSRYSEKLPKYTGKFLLHGHRHSSPDRIHSEHSLDIGVDGHNYYPWSKAEILEIVAKDCPSVA
jgi:calcineurin-like phosphoesterase family protein